MASRAACGFPSPADDCLDRPLDVNEPLIQNQAATSAATFAGESMTGAGLFPGDIASDDPALTDPAIGPLVASRDMQIQIEADEAFAGARCP